MKTKIYYSVQSDGAGSAYPVFMETKALAEWDQEHMDEGWGEPCTGSIEIESRNVISCAEVLSPIQYYLERYEDKYSPMDEGEFLAAFFPDGLPKFTVECSAERRCYLIYVADKLVGKRFAHPEKAPTMKKRAALEAELNGPYYER